MKNQKNKRLFNYYVMIYPDKIVGSNEPCFTAYCPVLDIADSGKTIEEAFKNIKEIIKFHLECLKKEKITIPKEFSTIKEDFITTAKVSVCL